MEEFQPDYVIQPQPQPQPQPQQPMATPFNNNTMSPHTFLKSMMHIANAAVSGANASSKQSPLSIKEEDDEDDISEEIQQPSKKKAHSVPCKKATRSAAAKAAASDPVAYRGSPPFSPRWLLNALYPAHAHAQSVSASSSIKGGSMEIMNDVALMNDPSVWMTWCAACVVILAFAIFLSDVF